MNFQILIPQTPSLINIMTGQITEYEANKPREDKRTNIKKDGFSNEGSKKGSGGGYLTVCLDETAGIFVHWCSKFEEASCPFSPAVYLLPTLIK